MASTIPRLPLNTGSQIPALGLGTWQSAPGEVEKAVLHALKSGYRHIDCAYMYGNSSEVGSALAEAFKTGVCKREDVFVTSKLWCTYHSRVEQNLDMELQALGLGYLDLWLMHWPVPMNPNGNHPNIPKLPDGSRDLQKDWHWTRTWAELEKLPATGKVRAIGVCNFSRPYLQELMGVARTKPAVNQIENHPYLPQQEIVEYCKQEGVHVTAYSPFGSTGCPIFEEEAVKKVAERRGTTAGGVLLSYHVARGSSVIPKSVTPSRIEENLKIVELSKEDVAELDKIHKDKGVTRYVYPSFGVNLGFPDKQ
ncbi:MAG: hypothetical protein M1828_003958 [Chrysothrix sp. TS-e1954]|nr:MAG: hypothetical protein M1828_003958 [Chrysothrix sp. TS-e1954]